MVELLKKLCAPICVSGNEGKVREIIKEEIKDYCDSMYTDSMGNLYVEKKGKNPSKNKVMIAAHMDEVGFIVTDITSEGYLKIMTVGGVDVRQFPGKKVRICTSTGEINGAILTVPTHLLSQEELLCAPSLNEICIDIGTRCYSETLEKVSIGDTGVVIGDFEEIGNSKILSKALDDRCGCAILISLLKSECEYDFTAVFTVQEEVGCRGALVAAKRVNPDIAVAIDSTTACDIQNVPDDKTVCNLSKGGVLSFMDKGCVYNKELLDLFLSVAKEENIPVQLKRATTGANDSSSMQKASGNVRAAALSIPSRYIHTANSMIDKNDFENAFKLIKSVLPHLANL